VAATAVLVALAAAASVAAAAVRPATLAAELVICHVTAPRDESRNATTVANKVTFPEIARRSHPLNAFATNASNLDTCSPLALIR